MRVRVDRAGVDRHRQRHPVAVEDRPALRRELDAANALLRAEVLERGRLDHLQLHQTSENDAEGERHCAEDREKTKRRTGAAASHGGPPSTVPLVRVWWTAGTSDA